MSLTPHVFEIVIASKTRKSDSYGTREHMHFSGRSAGKVGRSDVSVGLVVEGFGQSRI
jgi:hypothetical protein